MPARVKEPIHLFFKHNLSLLAFGFLLPFISGFGQTFLLSLYVPSIEQLLQISNTEFGALYAIATIGSAATLPLAGGYFDKSDLKRYSLLVTSGLAAALLLLSFSYNIVMVLLAFYGLRLFGQGLMSHTSISCMARYFSANRGKAIGIASVGHPAGEAVLPILITLLIGIFGWRETLQISAFACAVLVAPLIVFLLNQSQARLTAYRMQARTTRKSRQTTSSLYVVREKRFWVITPVVFMIGFTNTAIFFFQLKLGAAKGWSPEWVAASISAFALAGAVGMMGVGPLVDRFSAKSLFPYHMIFYLLGLLALILVEHRIVYPFALALIGLGHGLGNTIKDAMLAEVYGSTIIGQIRSIFIAVMVISTALGPVVFGIFLDMNISYTAIFTVVFVATAMASLNGCRRIT
jgi:MFS family permease